MNKLDIKFSVWIFVQETVVSLLIFYGSAVSCHSEYDSWLPTWFMGQLSLDSTQAENKREQKVKKLGQWKTTDYKRSRFHFLWIEFACLSQDEEEKWEQTSYVRQLKLSSVLPVCPTDSLQILVSSWKWSAYDSQQKAVRERVSCAREDWLEGVQLIICCVSYTCRLFYLPFLPSFSLSFLFLVIIISRWLVSPGDECIPSIPSVASVLFGVFGSLLLFILCLILLKRRKETTHNEYMIFSPHLHVYA